MKIEVHSPQVLVKSAYFEKNNLSLKTIAVIQVSARLSR